VLGCYWGSERERRWELDSDLTELLLHYMLLLCNKFALFKLKVTIDYYINI